MRIQTLSIVVGTRACDARCPFCVSKMTGFDELPGLTSLDAKNLDKACRLAQIGQATTVLLTGKGEPTLYPSQLIACLDQLEKWQFPFIELQTNGLNIGRLVQGAARAPGGLTLGGLQDWCRRGLNTVALSTVGVDPELNAKIYHPEYPSLERTIEYLRCIGFTVRLCVMMMRGGVSTWADVETLLDFCRKHDVAQLTIRPIRQPDRFESAEVTQFVSANTPQPQQLEGIGERLKSRGTRLLSLMHGAQVYDVDGQNVCLADCLTVSRDPEEIRQIIYYADGRLAYDWQYAGAVFLSGRNREK